MQKTCAHCGTTFEIGDDDLKFYDAVSPIIAGKKYAVPPPTLCPLCRAQRRYSHINERRLYKRTSSKSGKEILSVISPDKPYKVYDQKEWWSDDWDPLSYGQEIDWNAPFFEQMQKLLLAVPHVSLVTDSNENSEYVHYSGWDKNCYLGFCSDYDEDCMFTHSIYYSKDTVDCYTGYTLELCYECVYCKDCYHIFFSQNCSNCSESAFLFDCLNCKNCFGCVGLRTKEYCFFNEQLSKADYEKAIAPFYPFTHESIAIAREQMKPLLQKHPRKAILGQQNEHVTGDYLQECKNVQSCFDCTDLEDCKFCTSVRGAKDCYDIAHWGHPAELCYESMGVGEGTTMVSFCECCWPNCSNLFYSCYCNSTNDSFGCVGLQHKKYCILNKQYTKEEYETLVPKLIAHMQKTKEWGEFFPVNMSLFDYNETMAQDYFPLSQKDVQKENWRWSDYESPKPDVKKVIPASKLPDKITDVPDDILNWAIECEVTGKLFRIVKAELDFYRKEQLPVPHIHPDERCRIRIGLRNPRKLWSRNCDNCKKPIETSFAPNREEIVYCEECYLKEVY